MSKYSKKSQEKIGEVMHEFKEGTLKSGKDGKGGKVTNRKQAIAIGISEAKEAGGQVPAQKDEKQLITVFVIIVARELGQHKMRGAEFLNPKTGLTPQVPKSLDGFIMR